MEQFVILRYATRYTPVFRPVNHTLPCVCHRERPSDQTAKCLLSRTIGNGKSQTIADNVRYQQTALQATHFSSAKLEPLFARWITFALAESPRDGEEQSSEEDHKINHRPSSPGSTP